MKHYRPFWVLKSSWVQKTVQIEVEFEWIANNWIVNNWNPSICWLKPAMKGCFLCLFWHCLLWTDHLKIKGNYKMHINLYNMTIILKYLPRIACRIVYFHLNQILWLDFEVSSHCQTLLEARCFFAMKQGQFAFHR